MKTTVGVRRWYAIHKWTSLVSTIFMLIACVTGLPLIFSEEIDRVGRAIAVTGHETGATSSATVLSIDALAERARALRPDAHLQLLYRDPADPGVVGFAMGETLEGPIAHAEFLRIDEASGTYLGAFRTGDGVMGFLFILHSELFAGVGGTLFLGVMAMVLTASIVSGIVLYAPFMRDRAFAVVRVDKNIRTRWFDLHNALGIVLTAWLLVVSITGVINTWASPITQYWLLNDMKRVVDADKTPRPVRAGQRASIDGAIAAADEAVARGDMLFVALPGSELTSDRHYLVVFTGDTPVTSRLYYGAVVNAHTGALIAAPELPLYLAAALLSQPLHFGDYGGLALKVVWAVLGTGTVVLLWSGLVLWWRKRRQAPEIILAAH